MDKLDLIREGYTLFGIYHKPNAFTNSSHCEECEEHNSTLMSSARETISLRELGTPGWDPICFVNGEGMKYYFPALVRLALESNKEEEYLSQFLFHLSSNPSFSEFTLQETNFVRKLLEYIESNYQELIEESLCKTDLESAIRTWYT